jgi:hypothetical protein
LIGFAGVALGLFFSAGGLAVGAFAVGGAAIGMFSFGGCAIASRIAIGGYASGHIAIGDTVRGVKTIVVQNHDFNSIKAGQVRLLIHQEYPHLWKPIVNLIASIFN